MVRIWLAETLVSVRFFGGGSKLTTEVAWACLKRNRPAGAGRYRADAVGGPSSEASKLWHRLESERRGSGCAPEITFVAVINYRCCRLRRLREVWLSGI